MTLNGIGKFLAAKIDEILAMPQAPQMEPVAGAETVVYPRNVEEWLAGIGLSAYAEAFSAAGYDNLLVCEALSEDDLNHIGGITKPGHRKTLLLASQELKELRKKGKWTF